MRPMLKNVLWQRHGEDLYLVADSEAQVVLSDPAGEVEALLCLLREGTRDLGQLAAALADRVAPCTEAEISEALAALDELGLLIDAAAPVDLSSYQSARYASNLAFFATFASLARSAASFQRGLLDAHVVFLGTGGLGSSAIQALAGAGVGRMTLVDNDVVELRNFARQYLYREDDVGRVKVDRAAEWVRAYNSAVDVRAVRCWIGGPDDVTDLLTDADLVVSGVDHPDEIDLWVNQACVSSAVPYVRGGMLARRVTYWSVDPGRSACLECDRHAPGGHALELGVTEEQMRTGLDRVNRGIGPVASLVGAMVGLEALRYLTGFAPPIAAGCERFCDLASGAEEVRTWQRWPDCPACATVPASRRTLAGTRSHG